MFIYLRDKESGALPPDLLYRINATYAVSNTVLFKQIMSKSGCRLIHGISSET